MAAATDGPIGVWVPGPPMTEHPDYHSALLLQDGRVMILAMLVTGGIDSLLDEFWSRAAATPRSTGMGSLPRRSSM